MVRLTGKDVELELHNLLRPEIRVVSTSCVFFCRIFDIAPGAQQIFAKFRDLPKDELPSNPDVQKHALNVMETVGSAVDGLDDLEALTPVLLDLGAKHVQWDVQEEHFDVRRNCILIPNPYN